MTRSPAPAVAQPFELAELRHLDFLKANPGHADAFNALGVLYLQERRSQQALDCFARAVQLVPRNAGFWFNLGLGYYAMADGSRAVAAYHRAIELKPDYVDAHVNLGIALQQLRHPDQAIAAYDRALSISPGFAPAHFNRANALKASKKYDDAEAGYRRAISLKPAYTKALSSFGNLLTELGRFDEAVTNFDLAIASQPDFAEAHWNKALLLLSAGRFEPGWELLEWRFRCEALRHLYGRFAQPQWDGTQAVADKTILVHSEQGYGDTIHFCRYATMAARLGARVVMEVESGLINLMKTLEGVDAVMSKGMLRPEFDLHCPLMSMPRAFHTALATIPAPVRYLSSAPAKLRQWDQKLGARRMPRVGLAWSGNPDHPNDDHRSVGFADLIARLPTGFQYVGLQKDIRPADQAAIGNVPDFADFSGELQDFSDTAALCDLVDIVISVDTSVAHLAGALGKLTWVLLPFIGDWRWLRNRTDSPWYPTMKLYRQPAVGDWNSVFAAIGADLSNAASGDRDQ